MKGRLCRPEVILIILALMLLAVLQSIVLVLLDREASQEQLRARQMVLANQVLPQLNPELTAGLVGGHLGVRFRSLKESYPGIEPYVVDALGRVLFYVHEPALLKRERIPTQRVELYLSLQDSKQIPEHVLECDDPRKRQGVAPCSVGRISFGKHPAYLLVLMETTWAEREIAKRGFLKTTLSLLGISLLVVLILGGSLEWLMRRRQQEIEMTLAEISHDLRSPLASLISYLNALSQRLSSMNADEIARYLGTALRSARIVDDLNHEILELSSLSIGGRYRDREIISLDELLADVLARFRDRSDRQTVEFETSIPQETFLVEGSPRLLERLFSNLLENALRHSAGGKIWLRLQRQRGWLEVTIANTLIPGTRVSALKLWLRATFGNGESQDGKRGSLGLAIVRKIVAAHNGRFTLRNAEHGTVAASVRLPVKKAG